MFGWIDRLIRFWFPEKEVKTEPIIDLIHIEMDLKNQIQQIINNRNEQIVVIREKIENIDSLATKLNTLRSKILDLKFENSREYISKIDQKLTELTEAKDKALLLRKRFEKDTINIGVSGFTHAGKSTLLQAISGLTDDEIPKADEKASNSLHPTTALCSQIFNSEEEYAEIVYRSDKEFVDFINAHLASAGMEFINSKNEVVDLEIPENKDSEPDENIVKDRLRLIKESYKHFKQYIGSDSDRLKRAKFNRLSSYVSYCKNDASLRFYPAVKEVKIYCNFPALEDADVKLCLVDLPGFGEFDNVDEIQTKNLKEIVDHVLFVYKTNKDKSISLKEYVDCFKVIKNIHSDLADDNAFQSNFLSFFINEDRSYGDLYKNHVEQAVGPDGIGKYGKNYKYCNFPALVNDKPNVEEAKSNLGVILERLANTLPDMDNLLLNSFNVSLNLKEITFVVNDLLKKVNKIAFENDDPTLFHEKGKLLRDDFNYDLKELLQKYIADQSIDRQFEKKINELKKAIDSRLKEDLFYIPILKRETWEEYMKKKASNLSSTFNDELQRIWVAIINVYVRLDDEFSAKLGKLRQDILKIWSNHTGDFVENKEATDFSELLEKMSIISNNQIYKAFQSLDSLKQDFRQNIYPYIFRDGINYMMEEKESDEPGGPEAVLDKTNLTLANYKEQLVTISQKANFEISNTIKRYYNSSFFLIGALHTFIENVTFANMINERDFIQFCSIFRVSVYPEEYGSEADSVKIEELKKLLGSIENLITLLA